jgi:hypothetical protein
MRLICLIAVALVPALPVLAGEVPSAPERLAQAKEAGWTTFLLVTEPRARMVADLRAAAQDAQRRTEKSIVVELDRSDTANKEIVKRYGLAGPRLPIVLVIAGNGAPAGCVAPAPKAAERLVGLVPTPCKAATLLALFEKKAAFVVVGRPKKMPEHAAVVAACGAAVKQLENKAVVVTVDLDDKAEKAFLDVLGADRKATGVATHVYGLQGTKTGVLKGGLRPADLVKAAKQKAECCPGGKCG